MDKKKLVFPSTETVKQLIQDLNGIEWEIYQGGDIHEYIKSIEKKFFSRLQFLFTYLKETPETSEIPINFYRVRPFNDIINDKLICEYSYPIPKFTTKNGRANLINHPVFYASDHPVGAILEYVQTLENIETYKDQEFAISKWEIKNPGQYFFVPFFSSKITSHNIFYKLAEFTKEESEIIGHHISDDEYNALKILNDYFAELFLSDNNRCISSYLAHKNIYEHPNGHYFIMYASKMTDYYSNNYAFHPNFVDTKMELKHIYRVKIHNIERSSYIYKADITMASSFGVNLNGKIEWVDIENNLQNFNLTYRNDFRENSPFELQ